MNILSRLRKSRITKYFAVFVVFNLLLELVSPLATYALTGGPSQPEVQSFEPFNTTNLVDPFSGDFNYNIPLMDVGGYPINLSYNSNPSMDQEASWVGLGWNINPGAINRNMRGLPDDFNGTDKVIKDLNIKDNLTFGLNAGLGFELFGYDFLGLNLGFGVKYNNYRGVGFETQVDATINAAMGSKTNMNCGLGISSGADGGTVNADVSLSKEISNIGHSDNSLKGAGVGIGFNSRSGLNLTTTVKLNRSDRWAARILGNSYCATFSFATPTYTPTVDVNMRNYSLSLAVKLGGSFWWTHPDVQLSGYFSGQFLDNDDKHREIPAVGFLYSEMGNNSDEVLYDYNRENERSFTKHTPALPLTNFTYDVYTVSGQGIGGVYKPSRGDIGVISDYHSSNISGAMAMIGLEIGGGNIYHQGLNASVNVVTTKTGMWSSGNQTGLGFTYNTIGDLYEPSFFKMAGEMTSDPDNMFSKVGEFNAVKVKLSSNLPYNAMSNFEGGGSPLPINDAKKRTDKRLPRNENISYLKASEAKKFSLMGEVPIYTQNAFTFTNGTGVLNSMYYNLDKSSVIDFTDYPSHHIAEITATRSDGSRYIYGIPAYNLLQKEVSFAVDQPSNTTPSDGLVSYLPDDNTTSNNNGLDNYYSCNTIPKYAYSYLLTDIISADYVDNDGIKGPSDGDIGNYTKINYSQACSKSEPFNWRVPFGDHKANYNPGMKYNSMDDKANYIYGSKEIYYVHSIETKTQIALFYTSPRFDGLGVMDENGAINNASNKRVMKLDSVALYDKREAVAKGLCDNVHSYISEDIAKPIKVVHFEYDYSLCSNVPNSIASGGGKLTLKNVYFTYGRSRKGRINPYKFQYNNSTYNYNLKSYDRWGNFSPNPNGSGLSNADYPYVDQTTAEDNYSKIWNLKQIDLPSGGKIEVDYESDDYAFVQNKKAMNMMKIDGFSTSASAPSDPTLLYSSLSNMNYFIKFSALGTTSLTDFISKYMTDETGQPIKYLYFKMYTNVGKYNDPSKEAWEYVTGYSEIEYNNCQFDGTSNCAYIKLKKVLVNDMVPLGVYVNPVSQAAWNFVKSYYPEKAYNQPSPTPNMSVMAILDALAGTVANIYQIFRGVCKSLADRDLGKEIDPNKSFIRLYNPTGHKKGGGSRVTTVKMNDNWFTNSQYGQEFNYEMQDQNGQTISSGVASYEPVLGGEENPFRQPVYVYEKDMLGPNQDYYVEEPFGESFFPSPCVGYRKVTVKDINNTDAKNKTGSIVHEFYTAYDFPTITDKTSMTQKKLFPSPLLSLLKVVSIDQLTASQGFVVELNDMHGKPKAQWAYADVAQVIPPQIPTTQAPISGVEYKYKTMTGNIHRLDNRVPIVSKSGLVSNSYIGVDYDIAVDMREHKTETYSGGINYNFDLSMIFFPPPVFVVLIPTTTAWPEISYENVRFRSVTTTKVVNRYCIIDKVINYDDDSKIVTSNLLYDGGTGEVLLTEVTNQYKSSNQNAVNTFNTRYAFNYPAYWAYDKMGPAYENSGFIFSSNVSSLGKIITLPVNSQNINILTEGDEVYFINSPNPERLWVISYGSDKYLMKSNGSLFNIAGNYLIKILRSGHRNQHVMPIGNIVTMTNPNNGSGLFFQNVIDAKSSEFTDEARLYCDCRYYVPDAPANPFYVGKKGNWRPLRNWSYLTRRVQNLSTYNNTAPYDVRNEVNTDIRFDGVFSNFNTFWNYSNITIPKRFIPDYNNWTFTSEVTIYDVYGNEIENKDALHKYSSAHFGYNYSKPTLTANNSKYREVAFDCFEDYNIDNCEGGPHFNFEWPIFIDGNSLIVPGLSTTKSHTGKYCLKVPSGKTITINKDLRECNNSNN
ncbi:MAG: hypothetical protein HY951_07140 [Bacteroidia bacterium]|nr:hypothetical protein [Bacteroidia bacterium]